MHVYSGRCVSGHVAGPKCPIPAVVTTSVFKTVVVGKVARR
jgi:hypothetical protein